jgi:hypothetical protein
MGRDKKQAEILQKIRIGYLALLKQQEGIELLTEEIKILEELTPVDVTYTLLEEIDRLNNELVNLIYMYSKLKAKLLGVSDISEGH